MSSALLSTLNLFAKFQQNSFVRYVISIHNVKECVYSDEPLPVETWRWEYMNVALSSTMNLCVKFEINWAVRHVISSKNVKKSFCACTIPLLRYDPYNTIILHCHWECVQHLGKTDLTVVGEKSIARFDPGNKIS